MLFDFPYFCVKCLRMTITIEVVDKNAVNLLLELEKLKIIRLLPAVPLARKGNWVHKKEFKAIQIDTKGFKFDREEANER